MASGHVNRTKQAEHMAAPTSEATRSFSLPTRSRPHMALLGHWDSPLPCLLLGVNPTSLRFVGGADASNISAGVNGCV
jgi:hypothetical protein